MSTKFRWVNLTKELGNGNRFDEIGQERSK